MPRWHLALRHHSFTRAALRALWEPGTRLDQALRMAVYLGVFAVPLSLASTAAWFRGGASRWLLAPLVVLAGLAAALLLFTLASLVIRSR